MDLFFYLIIFLFGLIVGSFLNCVIYRLQAGGSFLRGRSYCPGCGHKLGWQDLIPLFSFLALRGRCRYCRKSISLQYPLVELAIGGLFVLIYSLIGDWGLIAYQMVMICFLVIIFTYDLKHYIIPDKVIYPAIGAAFLFNILNSYVIGRQSFLEPLLAALSASAFFLAIVLVSRGRWMGVGDIKLAFLMGLILGWPQIFTALFLAFLTGAIIGVGLIILGRKTLKSEVPFGPFLVSGTLVTLFWGQKLVNWYLNLF